MQASETFSQIKPRGAKEQVIHILTKDKTIFLIKNQQMLWFYFYLYLENFVEKMHDKFNFI